MTTPTEISSFKHWRSDWVLLRWSSMVKMSVERRKYDLPDSNESVDDNSPYSNRSKEASEPQWDNEESISDSDWYDNEVILGLEMTGLIDLKQGYNNDALEEKQETLENTKK